MTKPASGGLKDAFRAGRAAFLAKQPIGSNPMPEGEDVWNAWRNGWRCALEEWLETPEGEAFMALVFGG